MTIIWKSTFSPAGSQWAIHEKSTKIIRLHELVTLVKFVMADDYLFSSKPADLRMLSVCAERLFAVF